MLDVDLGKLREEGQGPAEGPCHGVKGGTGLSVEIVPCQDQVEGLRRVALGKAAERKQRELTCLKKLCQNPH